MDQTAGQSGAWYLRIAGIPSGSGRFRATRRFVYAVRRGGMLGQRFRRPARSRYQLAAAVRAPALEDGCRARAAEGALERADERLVRLRRKVPVAAFAVGPQLEHVGVLAFKVDVSR